MNLLDEIGKVVRDVIYEAFHEYTRTVDLEEIKEKGYEVKEFRLSPSGTDKLYVLSKGMNIKMGGSVTVDPDTYEVHPHFHTAKQTFDLLKVLSRNKSALGGSLKAGTQTKTNRNGEN